jgi:hypothetical protein
MLISKWRSPCEPASSERRIKENQGERQESRPVLYRVIPQRVIHRRFIQWRSILKHWIPQRVMQKQLIFGI